MGSVRQGCLDTLWQGRDPFANFPKHLYEADMQGWGSSHPYLTDGFATRRPGVVIEIGVWKGASSIFMATEMKRLGIDGVVLCVDTWLGSSEHWTHLPYFDQLCFDHGYPSLHRKFMGNVVAHQLQDTILPIPLDSLNAAAVMAARGIAADMIHLDGAHDYRSVLSDLQAWWPRLKPGGLLVGDDYYATDHWPEVKQAFDEFMTPMGLLPLEHVAGKCRVTKPA